MFSNPAVAVPRGLSKWQNALHFRVCLNAWMEVHRTSPSGEARLAEGVIPMTAQWPLSSDLDGAHGPPRQHSAPLRGTARRSEKTSVRSRVSGARGGCGPQRGLRRPAFQTSPQLSQCQVRILVRIPPEAGIAFVLWGVTVQPIPAVRTDLRDRFEFSLQGTDSLDGRVVATLSYQAKAARRVQPRGILSQFAEPQVFGRGRAWLDASDHRLRRWVDEMVVSDKTLPGVGTGMRSESE
jgi:hypothetical protein